MATQTNNMLLLDASGGYTKKLVPSDDLVWTPNSVQVAATSFKLAATPLRFLDASSNYVGLAPPTSITSSYTMKLPVANATANGQALISDVSGNLSFSNLKITVNTTTQNAVVLSPSSTQYALVLAPDASGSLIGQVPDGTATGGNARGNYSTDFQRFRTSGAHVASGTYSTLGGGGQNTASGSLSVVGGGVLNTASGLTASVGGGNSNTASAEASTVAGGYACSVSGYGGAVSGGQNNACAGQRGAIAGGQDNTVTSIYGMSPGGRAANSRLRGELAFSNGAFVTDNLETRGTNQTSMINWRTSYVNTVAAVTQELFLDGYFNTTTGLPTGILRYTLPNESTVNNTRIVVVFHIEVSIIDTQTGNTYGSTVKGTIKNYQGTCALVGTVIQDNFNDAGAATWSVTVDADNTNKALRIRVTTDGSTNWIKCHATGWMSYVNAFIGATYP